jgi:hypothetical protein
VFDMIVTKSLILALNCAIGSPAQTPKGIDNRNERNTAGTQSLRQCIKSPPWWILGFVPSGTPYCLMFND